MKVGLGRHTLFRGEDPTGELLGLLSFEHPPPPPPDSQRFRGHLKWCGEEAGSISSIHPLTFSQLNVLSQPEDVQPSLHREKSEAYSVKLDVI